MQEDPHSAGTGLGLSIVRAICKEMGATVDLSSQPGKGTRVAVRYVPKYVHAGESTAKGKRRDTSPEIPRQLHVDRFHLLTMDDPASASDVSVSGASVRELAREWLHCGSSQGPTANEIKGSSVCAIAEQDLAQWFKEDPENLNETLSEVAAHHSHILVLGRSIESIYLDPKLRSHSLTTVFVHQPIGPAKLLRAIASDQDSFTQPRPPDFGGFKRRLAARDESGSDHISEDSKPVVSSYGSTNVVALPCSNWFADRSNCSTEPQTWQGHLGHVCRSGLKVYFGQQVGQRHVYRGRDQLLCSPASTKHSFCGFTGRGEYPCLQ